MTTNLHDKMLAAIDALFSASDAVEEEVAENLLLDVRDELRKQPAQQDIPDLIAGALGVSRGTAYDMMREALAEQQEPGPHERHHMTTLTEILNNPEEHYPGNFDTPKRANALLTGLCQDAAIEIERLQKLEWAGLTDEDIDRVTDAQWAKGANKPIYAAHRAYARAIEAKLKEKNT